MSAQAIRFFKSFDGTRIAYAVTGDGPPLVKAPHWLTHLEYEYRSPIWRTWIEDLSRDHRLLRMDERACGLSDWDVANLSFDAYVRDLHAAVEASGIETPFALFGHSQGGAIAIEYAARHPEHVSHLVILSGYMRGALNRGWSTERLAEYEALVQLVAVGWGREDPTYRRLFSTQFIPGGTRAQIDSMSELQRSPPRPRTPRGSCAASTRSMRAPARHRYAAPPWCCMRAATCACRSRRAASPSTIPGARFVPLETDSHILLPHDPAYGRFFEELRAFLPLTGKSAGHAFASLTPREAEILEGIARGHDNARIAADLGLSEKTVRNNVTHIFDKLGVASRAQAIVLARDRGVGKS